MTRTETEWWKDSTIYMIGHRLARHEANRRLLQELIRDNTAPMAESYSPVEVHGEAS